MRVQIFLGNEQLFLTGAGALDVDGREHALVDQLAVQDDFHVAGTFELFEDHFVHARAGFDQRGGDDGQRAAFFNVAGRAEEALGPLQSIGIHAAGEHFARRRNDGVVSARQTRDGVQQDDHVALVLDQALGLFDHHFRHLNVARRGFIEGRADHLALHGALHVRDFFRTLVNQQNDQHNFGMIGGDGVGDVLQQHRLAGARRSDDQTALAFADRA